MSVLRIEKLIYFLKNQFIGGIQMFNTPSIIGDPRVLICSEDDIKVLFAQDYEYIEIYGVSDEEFERVIKEANGY